MSMLAVLLPLGLLLIALALAVFWWAARSGQFDDLETPAWRIVLDEDRSADDNAEAPEQYEHGGMTAAAKNTIDRALDTLAAAGRKRHGSTRDDG